MSMQQVGRRSAVLGTVIGAGALLLVAALYVGLFGTQPAPRTVAAAPVARDGVSAAVVARPSLDPPADSPVVAIVIPAEASVSPAVTSPPPPPPAPEPSPAQDLVFDDYYVHVPPGVSAPAPVLVALHGMGGTGRGMCDGVRAWSDREGWVLVGPTFA